MQNILKNNVRFFLLSKFSIIFFSLFIGVYGLKSQIFLSSGSSVTETFDGIGSSSTASLPLNWKMSAAGAGATANWSDVSNFTACSQAACGTSPTSGGRYNWGLSAACTDRAVGFMTSGTYSSPNSIMSYYRNNSGSQITDISVTFNIERYRINTSNFSHSFFYSLDGSTWIAANSGDIASGVFATGASSYTFAAPQTVNKNVTLSSINLSNNSDIYFKWVFINAGSSNSQGLGLDDVVVTPTLTACSIPAEPTIQANTLTVSNIGSNSMQLNWVRGNGNSCLLVVKQGSAVASSPVDGNVYTANTSFGSGSTIGASEYVVYNNTGSNVVVSSLLPNTTYYFQIFEYNSSGSCTNYFLSSSTISSTTLTRPYNFYRGNIHSHSAYSDGDLDGVCPTFGSAATCCYDIGNSANYFDFLGIADHNHNEGTNMTIAKYQSGLTEANNYCVSNAGTFVGLFGMEWGTISTGGHACVYGIDQLVGWNAGAFETFVAKGDYDGLFNLINSTSGAFAYLAHPNASDFNSIFSSAYNASYDDAIIGVSVENGPFNSTNTTYSNPPGTNDENRYKDLLKLGYHVGPGIDLDNHMSNSTGKSSQGRTVILASSLTKANVMYAYKNMHFYASEDYNVDVDYTINSTIIMGTITSGAANPQIHVGVLDQDGEATSSIQVFYGIPGSGIAATVLTSNTSSSTLDYTHNISAGTFYYYIKITQVDGQVIWTAPIWYTVNVILPIDLLCFDALLENSGKVRLNWTTLSEQNNDYFTIQRTSDGKTYENILLVDGASNSTSSINYQEYDDNPLKGLSYYRLKQTDFNGKSRYSNLAPIKWDLFENENIIVFPNPTSNNVNVCIKKKTAHVQISIYSAIGGLIKTYNFEKELFNDAYIIDLKDFVEGMYLFDIKVDQERYTKKIIKKN